MIRVSKDPTSARYVLSLLDKEGTLLDEYRPSGEGTLVAMESLFKKARSQALDLDGKLKVLYDHLKRLAGE
jgi:hypothetical protein